MDTSFLRAVPGQAVQWPYSLRQLADDVLLETGVFVSLNAPVELFRGDPFWFFPYEALPAPEPSDPRTRRVVPVDPVRGEDGSWHQGWTERDATQEEVDVFDQLNQPAPNWPAFQIAAMTAPLMTEAYLATKDRIPWILSSIPTLVDQAGKGDPTSAATLAQLLQIMFSTAGTDPEELKQFIASLAAYNLPAPFMAALASATEG